MNTAAKPNTDSIAAVLQDQCRDWNGAALTDESETRNSIYCGQLRAILTERGHLRTDLRHWRHEVGKLHSQLDRAKANAQSLTAALKACVEAMGNDHPGSNDYWKAVELADDAIAKAEGRP